jgi:predicted membrane protein
MKLTAKTILIVLLSLCGFTLTVLLIFYFYRRFLGRNSRQQKAKRMQNSNSSEPLSHGKKGKKSIENVKYTRANQNENNRNEMLN